MSSVLAGIRVLDFGRYMAGPYCAALLADLGAEVIRIERVEGGEDRFNQYPVNEDGLGASFLALNRNKLGITLDLSKAETREILRRLVISSDIIVANLPMDVMRRIGIDYQSLVQLKPDIIVTGISAFGETGPYARRVGLDGLGQAMSGAAYLSGQPDAPSKSFAPWVDILAGTLAAFGTVAAIRNRDATGEGQQVSTDLLTTGIAALSWIHTEQAATQINRIADGNRTQSSAPGDIFRTRDGWVLMQTIGKPLFERWCQLVGEPHWLQDSRFKDDINRSEHRDVLCQRTQLWAGLQTTEEAIQKLSAARIPCGPVLSPQQVLDDPHVVAREIFTNVEYPGLETPAKVMSHPVHYSTLRTEFQRPPPVLGEHTDAILSALGFLPEAIAEYRRQGVI